MPYLMFNYRLFCCSVKGFYTAKGELVKSILYPKPVDFKFERDTYKFVGVLAMIAGLGFIYTIIMEVKFKIQFALFYLYMSV